MMPVKVATHVTGTLIFASGPLIQVTLSFDVAAHKHLPYELYGTEVPCWCPTRTSSRIRCRSQAARAVRDVPVTLPYADANYRSIGVADMAYGILNQPAAPRVGRAGAACARGDGGLRSRQQAGPRGRHHNHRRAPGADLGVAQRRQAQLNTAPPTASGGPPPPRTGEDLERPALQSAILPRHAGEGDHANAWWRGRSCLSAPELSPAPGR